MPLVRTAWLAITLIPWLLQARPDHPTQSGPGIRASADVPLPVPTPYPAAACTGPTTPDSGEAPSPSPSPSLFPPIPEAGPDSPSLERRAWLMGTVLSVRVWDSALPRVTPLPPSSMPPSVEPEPGVDAAPRRRAARIIDDVFGVVSRWEDRLSTWRQATPLSRLRR